MNDSSRRLMLAAYLVAVLFVLSPVLDVVTNVWPWAPGSNQWRFGLVGITSNYVISAIFGLLLAAAVAAAAEQRVTLRVVAALAAVSALGLLVLSGSFILDTFELARMVQPEQKQLFRIGAFKTLTKMMLSFIGMLVLSIGAFKAAGVGKSGSRKGNQPLLVREG